ncbi:hypothetical protein V6N12_003273 [Hibiscus sabdariffa]|uniref:Uncharacterized protein n=1 Tax=Hibiscus sabdariffa TaxID=183260 RepID=A0ABR2EBE1_9ROSI
MENSQASSAENLPTRFQNTAAKTRYYNVVAQKKIWEEQGFFFDDGAENYGLETIIYRRLLDLDWFCLGRKEAQANLSWVREFYAHNVVGNDAVEVRDVLSGSSRILVRNAMSDCHAQSHAHYSGHDSGKITKFGSFIIFSRI